MYKKLKIFSTEDREILKKIGELADKNRVDIYAVGGYVRDQVMGNKSKEIDFVVVGDSIRFSEMVKEKLRGRGFVVYPKFGTASFVVGDRRLEFVTARKESYREDSRKPDVVPSTLKEDLLRRDFTINTLAVNINRNRFGEVIDFFNGISDIKKGIIRTVLDPEETFSDDPLRIMRAARFASQLQFDIDPETLEAMKKSKDRLRIVSQERITDEILKILSHSKPSIGLRVLQQTSVLEVVFPELAAMSGVEQKDEYHHKDVFEHTLKVVDNVANVTDNPMLIFTALVHDIGKPRVKRFVEGAGWTFHGHEVVGARMLKRICSRLRLPKEYFIYSEKLTRLHMRPINLIGEEVTDSAIRRLIVQAGDEIDDLLKLCRADITSGNPKRVKNHLKNFERVARRIEEVEEKDRMRQFQSPVRGDEIMRICGIGPGPLVGKIKKMIEEAILDGDIPNEYDAAHKYLLKIKDDILNDLIDH